MPIIADKHTNFYKMHKNEKKSIFFDERTLGIDLFPDPCEKVTNIKFKKYVNSKINCRGSLCKDSQFKCVRAGEKDCYHVVHIINPNGPEFPCRNDCKNIVANLVFMNGNWNSGLGGLSRNSYHSAMKEKELVLGKEIIDRIRNQIAICNDLSGRFRLESNDTDNYDDFDLDDDDEAYVDICDTSSYCECNTDEVCGCDCSEETELNWEQYIPYKILLWLLLAVVCICVVLILILCITCGFICCKRKTTTYTYDQL
jgi:hypothetical protein